VIPCATLRDLADEADLFLVDQFGTLHDSARPYPGAVEALLGLRAAGKRVVLLTNSGRRAAFNVARLAQLGFPPETYDLLLSSGEHAWRRLAAGAMSREPRRCLLIARGEDRGFFAGLNLVPATGATDADLVIIAGSEAERIPLTTYEAMLWPAAERRLPCYCTNPDLEMVLPEHQTAAPGAGRIANLYAAMGGSVTWIGKPYPEIYHAALALLGAVPGPRVIGIGDSLLHDVAGASGAGCRAALLREGIIAGTGDAALEALIATAPARPDFLVERFVW
jgi:HAD superfamily hydrolase (TIGR01459 family)